MKAKNAAKSDVPIRSSTIHHNRLYNVFEIRVIKKLIFLMPLIYKRADALKNNIFYSYTTKNVYKGT